MDDGRWTMDDFWDHFGVTLGSLWGHFGVTLGSLWDHFGVTLGSLWDHFGIMLGSIRVMFGKIARVPWPMTNAKIERSMKNPKISRVP